MSDAFEYDIRNWYFSVTASSPGTQVYGTFNINGYVALADATYQAWLTAGGVTSTVATEAVLATMFDHFAQTLVRPNIGQFPSAVDVVLTNPMPETILVNFSASGKVLKLAPSGRPDSAPMGIQTLVVNTGPNNFDIKDATGAAIGVTVNVGDSVEVVLIDNNLATGAAGTWYGGPIRQYPVLGANEFAVGRSLNTPLNKTVAQVRTILGHYAPISYAAGRYYTGSPCAGGSSVALAANTVYYFPIVVSETHTFDRIGFEVTATGAGANARLAIYNCAGGVPTSRIVDGGTVAIGTTGFKTVTVSQALDPGVYFGAIVTDGAVTVISISASAPGYFGFIIGATNFSNADALMSGALTFGAFPSTAGAPSYTAAAVPVIGLRA